MPTNWVPADGWKVQLTDQVCVSREKYVELCRKAEQLDKLLAALEAELDAGERWLLDTYDIAFGRLTD